MEELIDNKMSRNVEKPFKSLQLLQSLAFPPHCLGQENKKTLQNMNFDKADKSSLQHTN